jgi:hypothetical protein
VVVTATTVLAAARGSYANGWCSIRIFIRAA